MFVKIGRDARDALSFLLRDGLIFDAIITDPPYDTHHANTRPAVKRSSGRKVVLPFCVMPPEECAKIICEYASILKSGGDVYVFANWRAMLRMSPVLASTYALRSIVIWDKGVPGLGHYWRNQAEFVLYATLGKKPRGPQGNRFSYFPSNIIRFQGMKSKKPFTKPWRLYYELLKPTISRGMKVIDLFAGSCPLGPAADRLGAVAYCVDVDFEWPRNHFRLGTSRRHSHPRDEAHANHGFTPPIDLP